MKEEEARKVMATISKLNVDISNAKKAVAQEIHDFLQRNLLARPDRLNATMKFTAWIRLLKILKRYGAD